jgi:hypothetical protein
MKMMHHPEGNLLAGVDLLVDSQIAENVPKTAVAALYFVEIDPIFWSTEKATSPDGLPQWEPVPDCSFRA